MSTNATSARDQVTARRIVEALRSGVPSRDAVAALGTGQSAAEDQVLAMLRGSASGSAGVLLGGDFGSGKIAPARAPRCARCRRGLGREPHRHQQGDTAARSGEGAARRRRHRDPARRHARRSNCRDGGRARRQRYRVRRPAALGRLGARRAVRRLARPVRQGARERPRCCRRAHPVLGRRAGQGDRPASLGQSAQRPAAGARQHHPARAGPAAVSLPRAPVRRRRHARGGCCCSTRSSSSGATGWRVAERAMRRSPAWSARSRTSPTRRCAPCSR